MDDRQSKLLVALSAVLALLVLGIVFLEPPGPDIDDGRRWTTALPDWTADRVSAISLELDGTAVRMSRETGGWRWVEPVAVEADGARVDALVRSILDMELGSAVEVDPTHVGVVDTAPMVRIESTDGAARSVRIGEDAPVGSSTYVSIDGGPVQPTRTRLAVALPTTIEDLRVRTLTRFPRGDVQALRIGATADHPPMRFERDDHGWWRTDLDPRIRAAETHLHSVVDALRFAEAEAFHDSASPLGTDAWQTVVTYGTPPATADVRLAQTPDGTWLASGPGQPGQVTLAGTDLPDQLATIATLWAETRLAVLHPTALTGLSLQLDGTELKAERTADGWSDPRAEAVLMAIETGSADRTGASLAPQGPPTGTLTIDHGDIRSELVLYQKLSDGGRVATETGTEAALQVAPGTLVALQDALAQDVP